MIDPRTLELAYRYRTRNRIALALYKEGRPMDHATFLKQFKQGDLEDAIDCGLVSSDVAGITLSEGLARRMGRRQLAAEEIRDEIEKAIRKLFIGLQPKTKDKSRELQ